jgi:hypothetical protein
MTAKPTHRPRRQHLTVRGVCVVALAGSGLLGGQNWGADSSSVTERPDIELELLTVEEWQQLDTTVDRGLKFLSGTQRADGSFKTEDLGQPGITSLCVMAFLARGHVPEEGPYGDQLARAIDFVLDTQQDNGLLFNLPIGSHYRPGTPAHAAMYNHAMAGLMLSEVYGMTDESRRGRVAAAISQAVKFTQERQRAPKRHPRDLGGWRYLGNLSGVRNDADMSVTSWQLLFLRSARNAEFEVPKEFIDEAMGYVRRSFEADEGGFSYCRVNPGHHINRAIVGSGILSLSLGGEHQSAMARAGGDWLLEHDFDRYNESRLPEERYHYSAYYCSQAMFQLGGDYWSQFFPPFMRTLIANQQADGSWERESSHDGRYGNSYTTALVILSLTPPYQLLPIYQR